MGADLPPSSAPMNEDKSSDAAAPIAGSPTQPFGDVIAINEGLIKEHLDKIVVTTVEETLNALLDAEGDQLCGAKRYEGSGRPGRQPGGPLRAPAAHQGR